MIWTIEQLFWQTIGRLFCSHPSIFKTDELGICTRCHKSKSLYWWYSNYESKKKMEKAG